MNNITFNLQEKQNLINLRVLHSETGDVAAVVKQIQSLSVIVVVVAVGMKFYKYCLIDRGLRIFNSLHPNIFVNCF